MDLREELTRQSLLLEFISECVSLQSVPALARLVTTRLHWICEHHTCSALLPDLQGLTLWSQDRRAEPAAQIADDAALARHRATLDDAMARGAPVVACDGASGMFLAALPLGSKTAVHGALCVARPAQGFSHGDVRHLQHASNAVGGALCRIAALATEHEAERAITLAEHKLRAAAEDRVLLAEQMVGIVSHDLRNPLSAILMGTTLLGRGEALSVPRERVLQNVRNAAGRAQRLVEELLDFTRARVGTGLDLTMTQVDLDQLMTAIVDELRLSFSDIAYDPPAHPLGTAHVDGDRIHQMLGNLVANAAMYGAPGRPVRLACTIDAGARVLSVRNEGAAIPEALLAAMFEPMMRGPGNRTAQRGVGLGLYIVRAIAEAHGGTVGVTSTTAAGTCFSVRLPRDCHAV